MLQKHAKLTVMEYKFIHLLTKILSARSSYTTRVCVAAYNKFKYIALYNLNRFDNNICYCQCIIKRISTNRIYAFALL